jgi:RNA polymerase sigma factor (sigma-70 family)
MHYHETVVRSCALCAVCGVCAPCTKFLRVTALEGGGKRIYHRERREPKEEKSPRSLCSLQLNIQQMECPVLPAASLYSMKTTMNDMDLLRQYSQEGSEQAFAALVDRHLNLVYATSLRQVRSPELAEEAAQSVFLSLARNAGSMKPNTILTAWLYRVARHAAIDLVRRESRRQVREQMAFESANMKSDSSEWAQIEPLLDEALEALEETDRNAILLRFFRNKSLREVGEILGTSEEAARKRVSRALEQLRPLFSRRGVAVGVASLAAVLSTHAAHAAPAGLGATISAAVALFGGALHQVPTIAATKAITMTMLQKTLITAAIAVAVGADIYQARQGIHLRKQAHALQQEQESLASENRRLQQERDDATSKLAVLQGEMGRVHNDTSALLKLRAEVAKLRGESRELAQMKAADASSGNDPTESAMKSWLDRAQKLKGRLAQTPNQAIPEFKFLTDQDWLDAVKKTKQLETDSDFSQGFKALRSAAKNQFASIVQDALAGYSQANNGQLPSDFSQLQPYFASSVDDSVLQNYSITQPGTVTEKTGSLIDPDGNYYYSSFQITLGSISSSIWGEDALHQAIQSFLAANNGLTLTDPTQLLPYAQTPAEQAALQKILQRNSPVR